MRKRFIALFVATIMCISLLPMSAIAEMHTNRFGESQIFVITEKTFRKMFDSTSASVNYEYRISPASTPDSKLVEMSIEVVADTNTHFAVSGEVECVELSDSISILQGPLYGIIRVDGIIYNVTVGFTKLSNSDAINAGVVISPDIQDVDQVLFAFGSNVITDEVQSLLEKLESNNSSNMMSTNIGSLSTSSSSYTNLGSVTTILNGVSTQNAQKLTAYYYSGAKRVGARVQTYTSSIKSYYSSLNYTSCSVKPSNIKVTLKRAYSSETSSIIGIDESHGAFVGSNLNLCSRIVSILGDFGVPTSGFSALLEGLTGTLTKDVSGSQTYSNVKFGINSNTSGLDTTGFAVSFNIYNPSSRHYAKYYVKSDVQYNVSYNVPLSGSTSFYISANQAQLTKDIYV